MGFVWRTPKVTQDGICYSITYLPGMKTRLKITGSGAIPGVDGIQPWIDFPHTLDEIYLEEGITSIGERAFAGNPLLRKVWLPNSISAIQEGAFEDCPELEEICYCGTLQELNNVSISDGAIPDWFDWKE